MLLIIALTACSTPPPKKVEVAAQPAAVAGTDIQCHIERPTGSLIGAQVCTTAEQRAAMRRSAQGMQDAINKIQGTSCAHSASGC